MGILFYLLKYYGYYIFMLFGILHKFNLCQIKFYPNHIFLKILIEKIMIYDSCKLVQWNTLKFIFFNANSPP